VNQQEKVGGGVALSPVALACESTLLGGDVFVQPALVLRGTQDQGVSGGAGLEFGLVPGDKRRGSYDADIAVLGSVQALNDAMRLSVGPGLAMLYGSGEAVALSLQYAASIPFDDSAVDHSLSVNFSIAWDFK